MQRRTVYSRDINMRQYAAVITKCGAFRDFLCRNSRLGLFMGGLGMEFVVGNEDKVKISQKNAQPQKRTARKTLSLIDAQPEKNANFK